MCTTILRKRAAGDGRSVVALQPLEDRLTLVAVVFSVHEGVVRGLLCDGAAETWQNGLV